MAREIKIDESYLGKLLKLIPSEIVVIYLGILGLIPSDSRKWGLFVVSLLLLLITPFYLRMVQGVKGVSQIVVSTLSLVVWLYSLGGPFEAFGIYRPWIASVALLFWTTFLPRFIKNDGGDPKGA